MSDEDAESYSNVLHMLEPTADLLELLRTYEGCGEYIRKVRDTAPSNPHPAPHPPLWSFFVISIKLDLIDHRFGILGYPTKAADRTTTHAHDAVLEIKQIGNVFFFSFFVGAFSLCFTLAFV